jgi:putative radical SAM enzyme (TIGR03279 family)
MPLFIQDILPRSLAAKNGLKAGDKLLSINGHDISDFIDLQFYGTEGMLKCELESAAGERNCVEILRNDKTSLGIEPVSYTNVNCINNCLFCFIDQMPPGLRETLYIKDDDYLYSFVFGNYISLTNLSESDYERIIAQKLSPLFVSVHTTNPALRRKMMQYPVELDILDSLRRLSRADIQLHCQMVLVPDWNDGKELQRSLEALLQPDLNVLSIGIVPVGLTNFRTGLTQLRTFTPEEAGAALDITERFRHKQRNACICCSDEFFILAERPIPESVYYGDFPQLDNGIGMVRVMLENWKDKRRAFLREVRKKNHPLRLITGVAAAYYLEQIAAEITRKAECCPATAQAVVNDFMGPTVTVSGLLTFGDIRAQVQPAENEIVALPSNIFNHDGITLDGFSQLDIKEYWQRDILIIDPLFDDWEWI